MTVLLSCESESCNAGRSATDRHAAILRELPRATDEMRAESDTHARRLVSRALTVTPHQPSGATHRGGSRFELYACVTCGHERIYGCSDTVWSA